MLYIVAPTPAPWSTAPFRVRSCCEQIYQRQKREPRWQTKGRPQQGHSDHRAAIDDDAEVIGKKAIEIAKAGDGTALRLCLDRIAPARKDRHISFKLPKLEKPEQAVLAAADIVAAVANAELTPSEAADMMKLVEGYTRILEAEDHEQRLRILEGQLNGNGQR